MNRAEIIGRAIAHWPTNALHVDIDGPRGVYEGFSYLLVEQSKHDIAEYYLSYHDGDLKVTDVDHNYWRPIALVDLDTGMVENLDEVIFAVRSGRSWELDAEEVSS